MKGYDPTKTDFSALLLNHVFERWRGEPRLDLNQAELYVKQWLHQAEYTSAIYRDFKKTSIRPIIKLRKRCPIFQTSYLSPQVRQHLQFFPTSISTENNELVVCLDKINNKVELKENLDRQLTFLLKNTIRQSNSEENVTQFINKGSGHSSLRDVKQFQKKERQLMLDLYESCQKGYQNYLFDSKVTKQLSKICAKYLFFRKTSSDLPVDRRFRYSSQLADDNL